MILVTVVGDAVARRRRRVALACCCTAVTLAVGTCFEAESFGSCYWIARQEGRHGLNTQQ